MMRTRTVIVLGSLVLATNASAFLGLNLPPFALTGGRINDAGRNSGLNATRINEANIRNILGQVLAEESAFQKSALQTVAVLGQAVQVQFSEVSGAGEDETIAAAIDATEQASRDAGKDSLQLAALKQQAASLRANQVLSTRLREITDRGKRRMTLGERLTLQNELHLLNRQIFLQHNARNLESEAARSEAEHSKTQIFTRQEKVRIIQDNIGK